MENLASSLNLKRSLVKKTYIILPAFNEADALFHLIPKITNSLKDAHRPYEILVVNDGSTDRTSQILESFAREHVIRELRHDVNRGYGAALHTAFQWVAHNAQSTDAAVTVDADNTQDPRYIPALLNKLEEGYDVVTASYTMSGGHATGLPFVRRMMSAFLNWLFRQVYRWPGVETYTNGFRVYRISAILRLYERFRDSLIDEPGFPGGAELFIKVVGLNGNAAQVPFELHYENRGKDSKIHLLPTIQRYLKLLFKGRRYAHP